MTSTNSLKQIQLLFLKCMTAIILSTMATPGVTGDKISPEDFVSEASAAGIAEVKAANLALEKSLSPEIKNFSMRMITNHSAINDELEILAQRKKLQVATEAEALDAAKAKLLEIREGESFDEAFAKNQVSAHENSVELFRAASASIEDTELSTFAKTKLPRLEQHLKMARELAAKYDE